MKKHFLLFTAILLLFGSFSACKKGGQCEPIDIYPIINNPQATLVNTKWKLVGFVDVAEKCLKNAEPTDCEQCYTLTFYADTLFGKTTTNSLQALYKADYETTDIQIFDGIMTEVGENADGYRYSDALFSVRSFSLQEKELRLYYNDNKEFLLFKLQ